MAPSEMKYYQEKRTFQASIIPLLILHNKCLDEVFPDMIMCPWNVRLTEVARLSCPDDSKHSNIFLNLITEDLLSPNCLLEGSIYYCAITSFAPDNDPDSVPLKSMRGERMDTKYYAKPISVDILNKAVRWLNSQSTDSVDIPSALDKYLFELKKIPLLADQGVSELLKFIRDHDWSSVYFLWGQDELSRINLRTSDKTDDEEYMFLRRYVHENLAKATKVMVHWSDGIHRASSYDGASTCSLPPKAHESLKIPIQKYFRNREMKEKHDRMPVQVHFFYGNVDSTNLTGLGESMIELSKTVQMSAGRQKPHSVREYAKSVLLDLKKSLEGGGPGFLLGNDNEIGLGKTLSSTFPMANYANPREAQAVLVQSQVLPESEAAVLALYVSVNKPWDVSEVFIQCWVNFMQKLIRKTMIDNSQFSSEPGQPAAWDVLDMTSVFTDLGKWESMFQHAKAPNKKFSLFPFGLTNTPFVFLKLQDAYSPNRYSKKYTADQFLFCQLMLMALTSKHAFTTILNCLENTNPSHLQSSSGNEIETSQWLTCLVESIVSSVYYSHKYWKKGCFAPPRIDHPNIVLRNCDQVVDLCLLSSAISHTCEFFSATGVNPIPPPWYTELRLSFNVNDNEEDGSDGQQIDMSKFAAPMKRYLSFVVCAFILYMEDKHRNIKEVAPSKAQTKALMGKLLVLHIRENYPGGEVQFNDGTNSPQIVLFDKSIGGQQTLDPRQCDTTSWKAPNLVEVLSFGSPTSESSEEDVNLCRVTHRIMQFFPNVQALFPKKLAEEVLNTWYATGKVQEAKGRKTTKKRQQVNDPDYENPGKKKPKPTKETKNDSNKSNKGSKKKKNSEKTAQTETGTSTGMSGGGSVDIDNSTEVAEKTSESPKLMDRSINSCYALVLKELKIGGHFHNALKELVGSGKEQLSEARVDTLFHAVDTLISHDKSSGDAEASLRRLNDEVVPRDNNEFDNALDGKDSSPEKDEDATSPSGDNNEFVHDGDDIDLSQESHRGNGGGKQLPASAPKKDRSSSSGSSRSSRSSSSDEKTQPEKEHGKNAVSSGGKQFIPLALQYSDDDDDSADEETIVEQCPGIVSATPNTGNPALDLNNDINQDENESLGTFEGTGDEQDGYYSFTELNNALFPA